MERTRPLLRDPVTIGILVYAAYMLALGLVMTFAAGWFFRNVGPFGIRNDHYTRDNAMFALAFAAVGFVALRRPTWRLPVLSVYTIQATLHAINHLYDINRAHPKRDGPIDFALIALSAAVLGWLTWLAARAEREP
ncbi:MAG: hypothetical protein ACJ77M_20210 [Thermoleophilaceae bacterium]|jgi:hypothetical protein